MNIRLRRREAVRRTTFIATKWLDSVATRWLDDKIV